MKIGIITGQSTTTKFMKTILISIIGLVPFISCFCHPVNNGEDITRPVTRFDNRLEYQEGSGSMQGKDIIYTARADSTYTFENEWVFSTRVDLPYEWFYCPNNANQCNLTYCYQSNCMGDSLIQMILIAPDFEYWTIGGGFKMILPTAGDNVEIGMGRYQFLPTLACRYSLRDWSPGAYCGLILRQDIDLGGFANAAPVSQTFIQPFMNVDLPMGWFLYSSPEMIYNWETSYWFIPFDLMLGWMITDKLVISIEYENGIVQDYPKYGQEVEFRIGIFF